MAGTKEGSLRSANVQTSIDRKKPPMRARKIRVGPAGAGNCASSLAQGLPDGARARDRAPIARLMQVNPGCYAVGDIEVSTFVVAAGKVGHERAGTIFVAPDGTELFAGAPLAGAAE